jgi:hypothetical protein
MYVYDIWIVWIVLLYYSLFEIFVFLCFGGVPRDHGASNFGSQAPQHNPRAPKEKKKREDVGSIRFGFYFKEKGRERGWGEGGVFFGGCGLECTSLPRLPKIKSKSICLISSILPFA